MSEQRNRYLTEEQRLRRNYLAMLRKRKYRSESKGKITDRKYRKDNKERLVKYQVKWRRESGYGIKNSKSYRSKPNNKLKLRVRFNTKYKYGKLKKGYDYHHWEPYNKDNFTILESKFHKFYHANPKLFNMKGRI